jgi:hypothetical protein
LNNIPCGFGAKLFLDARAMKFDGSRTYVKLAGRYLAGNARHNTGQNVTFRLRQPMAAFEVRPDPALFAMFSIRTRIDRYRTVYILSVRCEKLQ